MSTVQQSHASPVGPSQESCNSPRMVITLEKGKIREVVVDKPIRIWLLNLDAVEQGLRAGEVLPPRLDDNTTLVKFGKYIHPSEVQQLRREQLAFAAWQDKVYGFTNVAHFFWWDGKRFHDHEQRRPNIRMFIDYKESEVFCDVDTGEPAPPKAYRATTREGAVQRIHSGGDYSEHSPINLNTAAAVKVQ